MSTNLSDYIKEDFSGIRLFFDPVRRCGNRGYIEPLRFDILKQSGSIY